ATGNTADAPDAAGDATRDTTRNAAGDAAGDATTAVSREPAGATDAADPAANRPGAAEGVKLRRRLLAHVWVNLPDPRHDRHRAREAAKDHRRWARQGERVTDRPLIHWDAADRNGRPGLESHSVGRPREADRGDDAEGAERQRDPAAGTKGSTGEHAAA